ncbi:MAG: hypothetical protein GX973_07800 [Firmicutes bacterium]|nr:hypothetical protein [Bacillota bacterium]
MDKAVSNYIEFELSNYDKRCRAIEESETKNTAYYKKAESAVYAINKVLTMLGERYKELFHYQYREGLPNGKVIIAMDISERTYYRMKRRLINQVGRYTGLYNGW